MKLLPVSPFKYDPFLQCYDLITVLCLWCHNCDYFCKVILKTLQLCKVNSKNFQQFRSYGADKKCRLLTLDFKV
jgi:hypothetical protein